MSAMARRPVSCRAALAQEHGSNPNGSCVEVAELPDGAIAVRNSRDPFGPAFSYTRAEVTAFGGRQGRRVRRPVPGRQNRVMTGKVMESTLERSGKAVIWCCVRSPQSFRRCGRAVARW